MFDMQHVYNVFHNVNHSNFHKYLYYQCRSIRCNNINIYVDM